MGINRYPGNVITSDANTPTVTSASGTWTLEEAYQNIGNWPMAQSQIQNSLRFNSADSAYLGKTFASAGNRRTWAFSAWVKRSGISTTDPVTIFSAGPDGTSPRGILDFNNTNTLRFGFNDGSSWYLAETTAVFRDPSAWYHIVVKCDLTNATQANRVGVYVNGVQQTTNSVSWPNADQVFNNAVFHGIGRNYANGTYYFPGYITEINFIDGLALSADYFGFFDANGIWQPKQYKGAYGTNGFYLPFSGTTPFYSAVFDGSGDEITGSLPSGALGTGDFTVEYWMYNSSLYDFITAFSTTRGSTGFNVGTDAAGLVVWYSGGARQIAAGSVQANRWNHFAFVRSGSTLTAYLNGTSVGSATVTTDFSATSFAIGSLVGQNTEYVTGYMSNVRVVVGSAVYTSNFTVPVSPLTNITNTKLLTLQSSTIVDNSSSPITLTVVGNTAVSQNSPPFAFSGIGSDFSGNTNNWSPFNISLTPGVGYDSMVDVPTNQGTDTGVGGEVRGNYCTMNGVDSTNITLSNGNLTGTQATSWQGNVGTFLMTSGKWYWEVTGDDLYNTGLGVIIPNSALYNQMRTANSGWVGAADGGFGIIYNGAGTAAIWYSNYYTSYSISNYLSSGSNGDVLQVAFDADSGKIWIGKNNTWGNNGTGVGDPANGTNPADTLTTTELSRGLLPFFSYESGQLTLNAGQRPFSYTAPSGFKALCTQNLSTPTILDGSQYMNATLWTGNGATQTITTGLANDLVWTKDRGAAYDHTLFDVIRTPGYFLRSNATSAEEYRSDSLTAFTSTGFSVGADSVRQNINKSGNSYVSWVWKAGGTGVTNTAGTITSTVSANPTAGFSIVTYTGTGSTGTVGHGLGAAPSFIIAKRRNASTNWQVYAKPLGATSQLILNGTGAAFTYNTWNNTTPTSSVFSIDNVELGASGGTYVAYCFAPVAGYSAFGSYTGNGSSDGPFVYTGFRPRYLMIKSSTLATSWWVFDSARSTYNVVNAELSPDQSSAEVSGDVPCDFVSNGIKFRSTWGGTNSNGATYIYAAFAENPFKLSRAR